METVRTVGRDWYNRMFSYGPWAGDSQNSWEGLVQQGCSPKIHGLETVRQLGGTGTTRMFSYGPWAGDSQNSWEGLVKQGCSLFQAQHEFLLSVDVAGSLQSEFHW